MSSLVDDLTKNITVEQHLKDVISIMDALDAFHAARESTYAMSFAQRGEIGVWMNLARKYDRIDNLARKTFDDGGSNGVTLVDTLVDTAMYALKWIAIIKHVREQDLHDWIVRTYCHDTSMSVEEALELFGFTIKLPKVVTGKHPRAIADIDVVNDMKWGGLDFDLLAAELERRIGRELEQAGGFEGLEKLISTDYKDTT